MKSIVPAFVLMGIFIIIMATSAKTETKEILVFENISKELTDNSMILNPDGQKMSIKAEKISLKKKDEDNMTVPEKAILGLFLAFGFLVFLNSRDNKDEIPAEYFDD